MSGVTAGGDHDTTTSRREASRKLSLLRTEVAVRKPLFVMAGRTDSLRSEILTQEDLDELRYNLAHLSVDAVRRF